MEFAIWDKLNRHGFVRDKSRGLWVHEDWRVAFSQEYLDYMPLYIALSNIDMVVRLSVKAEVTQKPYSVCLINSDGSNTDHSFPPVNLDNNKANNKYLYIGNAGLSIKAIS